VDCVYKTQDIVAVVSVFVVRCKKFGSPKNAALPDILPAPSVPLSKARSATFSEPARRGQDACGEVIISSLSPSKKNEWMG